MLGDDGFDTAVKLAINLEVRQCDILGRQITPIERRWVVRAGFRYHFKGTLSREKANELADDVLEIIDETKQHMREQAP